MFVKADIQKIIEKYSNQMIYSPEKNGMDCLRDKAYYHSYDTIYPELLEKYLNKDNLNILEIGVYYGGSLLAWNEIFPNSNIYGIDNDFSRLKVDIKKPYSLIYTLPSFGVLTKIITINKAINK